MKGVLVVLAMLVISLPGCTGAADNAIASLPQESDEYGIIVEADPGRANFTYLYSRPDGFFERRLMKFDGRGFRQISLETLGGDDVRDSYSISFLKIEAEYGSVVDFLTYRKVGDGPQFYRAGVIGDKSYAIRIERLANLGAFETIVTFDGETGRMSKRFGQGFLMDVGEIRSSGETFLYLELAYCGAVSCSTSVEVYLWPEE